MSTLAPFIKKHRALLFLTTSILLLFIGKIAFLPFDYHGDYGSYQLTAEYIAGERDDVSAPRMLKPLQPALTALLSLTGLDYQTSFLLIIALFFIALSFAVHRFYLVFFHNERRAFAATLITLLTYPMLRYGLDAYTEVGSWFFYFAGLAATLSFLKQPSWKMLLLNAGIAAVGFLWKEYSIIHVGIFALATLFNGDLSLYRKIRFVMVFISLFLASTALWQIIVYLAWEYSYFTWYATAGASGFGLSDYSLLGIGKSLFALLMVGWLFVPFAKKAVARLASREKLFFWLALILPGIVLAWGYVSSRLYFVLIPSLAIAAVFGIDRLSRGPVTEKILLSLIPLSHLAWLWYKYFG